jgi:dihydrolipoamide dehydrogenase
MITVKIDVANIGAGTAGLVAYRTARAKGASAVIIEGGDYGTTCARVGCMPSKLLIAATGAAHAVGEAPAFGIHPGAAMRVDGREVMDRVRRERDHFVAFALGEIQKIPDAERIRGRARFVNDHTLAVADHTRVEAKSIVIATGAPADYPD